MRGLKIANSRIRDAVLNGVPRSGPPSLKSNWARSRYLAPEGLDDAFNEAIKITDSEMKKCQNLIKELEKKLPDSEAESQIAKLQVKQHLYDPEVQYNHLIQNTDLNIPVYRYLAQRDWHKREMLVLLQRIEQHHVIPDTLPTIDPRAKVEVKFPTPAARWIEPGEVLASTVTERLPQMKVTDFTQEGLYTVVIVNPDVPDIDNDSYKSELHFGAVNVPISFSNPNVDFKAGEIFKDYLPPHPAKNLPAQRFCIWVFRQPNKVSISHDDVSTFDIRHFTDLHNLDPVGVQMWRSQWDRYVPTVREKYGLGAGPVYYRARTAKPDEALLHIRHRKQWRE